jgi:hypothetical protein
MEATWIDYDHLNKQLTISEVSYEVAAKSSWHIPFVNVGYSKSFSHCFLVLLG